MNNTLLNILLFLGIVSGCVFYISGSYYFRYASENNIKFKYILIISILLGCISYLIKIPVFYYFGGNFSIMHLNLFFLVISFIMVCFYSKFILKEDIQIHTYIIMSIIVLLIIFDYFFKKNKFINLK